MNLFNIGDNLAFTSNQTISRRILLIEIALVAIAALLVHLVLWIGWTPHPGSDARSYVSFYVNVFESEQIADYILLFVRGPVPSFFHGWSLAMGWEFHIFMQTLLAISANIMVYLLARHWGRGIAVVTIVLFLIYLPMQLFFHRVSSEGVFAWTLMFMALGIANGLRSKSAFWIGIAGFALGIAFLSRPTAFIFAGLVLIFWFSKVTFRQKLIQTIVFIGVFILSFSPWYIYRSMILNDWTLLRPQSPVLFTIVYDMELIRPENGEETRRLIEFLEEELLLFPAYVTNNVGIEQIFSAGLKFYYLADISYLVNTKIGWNEGLAWLEVVAREAIITNPTEFLEKAFEFLSISMFSPERNVVMADGIEFGANLNPYPSLPDGNVNEIPRFSYYISHPPHFEIPSQAVYQAIRERETELVQLIFRPGNYELARQINSWWWRITSVPFAGAYLFVGLAPFVTKGNSRFYLGMMLFFSLSVAALSGIISPEIRYRMPTDFILLISSLIGVKAILLALTKWLKLFPNDNGSQSSKVTPEE